MGIMGVFKDKDYKHIIEILKDTFADVTVTRARGVRSKSLHWLLKSGRTMEWKK